MVELDLLVGQLNGGARQIGGLAGRKGWGAVIGQRTQETEPSQRLRSVNCRHIAEAVRADRMPQSLWRENEVTGGCGQSAEESPLDGLVRGGGSRDHGQHGMPPRGCPGTSPGSPLALGLPLSRVSTLSSAIRELISHI